MSRNRSTTKEIHYGITHGRKKSHHYMYLKTIDMVHFVGTLSKRIYFWDTAVPCGSENSPNVVQLNPDEDKNYLLTPYPTLMPPLKKFSPETMRANARNPNIKWIYNQ